MNKKRIGIIASIIVVIIFLLLSLKCCSTKKGKQLEKIDNASEYIEFVEKLIEESDSVFSEFELWLLELDFRDLCTPEIGEAFSDYGERLVSLDERFDAKVYSGRERIMNLRKWEKYFDLCGDMGKKMIEIAEAIEEDNEKEVLNLLDELIEIHQGIVNIRGELK